MKKRKNTNKKKLAIYLPITIVVAATVLFTVHKKTDLNILPFLNKTPVINEPRSEKEAETTSTQPTAQADFTEGDDTKQAGNSVIDDRGSGVITDNHGEISLGTDTSQPKTSQTGEISIYKPTDNNVLKSGQEISGKSTLDKVSYRIIDNNTGMIAMGSLDVIGGNFSGNISFDTKSIEGRIDFYGTKSDGVEFSNIEIPVRFR